jgi:hypothetical protein
MKEGQRQFRVEMDSSVGQKLGSQVRGEVLSVRELGSTSQEIHYGVEDGCQWVFEVDRDSRVILAWRFVSEPAKCYYKTDWFGPW